jgi:predicted membrane-bound mannosyltransferase
VILAAVGLFMVFRQGAKSQSHAAADAISAANAHAAAIAHAAATQVVNVNSGNTLSDGAHPSMSVPVASPDTRSVEERRAAVEFWETSTDTERSNARRLYP